MPLPNHRYNLRLKPGCNVLLLIEEFPGITEVVSTMGHNFVGFAQNITDNNLIKATHQAALDAVKEKE